MTTARKPSVPFRARVRSWIVDASFRQWCKRLLLTGLVGGLLLVALVAYAYSAVSLPELPDQSQTSVIVDAQGNQIAELFKDENRVSVPLREVADVMEQAVVATEDRNFYEHSGLDPIGITRALVNDVRGKQLQGGSTITQQLVKNTYLSSERSLTRKVKEAFLAVKVEQQMSKREILERYLNTIYFGRGAYGVEKAAQLYFGKPASELVLHEAALLAGLIRAPETADPIRHPEAAQNRRAIVLNAMVRAEVISEAESEAAKAAPLGAVDRRDPNEGLRGPNAHFVVLVRRWVEREFGEQLAFGGGLRIETTLNPAMQRAAAETISSILDQPDDPTAALVTMRRDGAVLAMIGGKDFQQDQVNLAVNNERPQAGSTFKPFVLAAALENDIPISQRYPGPARKKIEFPGFEPYDVPNYGLDGYGNLDLITATANSVNTVYAQMAADVGLDKVADVAERLGVESDIPEVPAMSLGTVEVSPYEMVNAYMTFANRGKHAEPYFVTKVLDDDGDVLYEARVREEEVYDPDLADVVNHTLTQTIERGTGRAADIGRPAAGKTGTTNDNRDAWFVGYTPRVGTAVWMGYLPDRSRPMDDVHGRSVTGGSFPAQIWGRYMERALEGIDTGDFEPPKRELLNAGQRDDVGGDEGDGSTTTSSTDTTTTTTPTESTTTTTDPDASTTTTSTPASSTTTTTTAPAPTTTTTAAPSG